MCLCSENSLYRNAASIKIPEKSENAASEQMCILVQIGN
jgi:hypothetical protein